jgi:hypothetical protein
VSSHPDNPRVISDPIFYALAIPAVLLIGLAKSGFLSGFGSMATPMLALVISVPDAAAIVLPLLTVMDAVGVHKLWRDRDRELLRLILPAGLVGIAVGIATFRWLSATQVSGVVGLLTLVFLIQRRLGWTVARMQNSRWWGRLLSATSGFTSFVAHAGGPPMMAYTLPLRLPPVQLTATMAVFFGCINLSKYLPYAALGLFDTRNFLTSLLLAPLAPLGVWAGIWLMKRVKADTFYLIAEISMLAAGVQLLAKAWQG